MPTYTVFWDCGDAGTGCQVAIAADAQTLCERMTDRLGRFLGDDEQAIRDALTVSVYTGLHQRRPEYAPAYEIGP